MREGESRPFASRQRPDQDTSDNGTKEDPITPEDTTPPLLQHRLELRNDPGRNVVHRLFQDGHDAIGPVDFDLLHTGINFSQILIAFRLEALPQRLVFDRNGGFLVIDAKKAPGRKTRLRQGALPRGDHVFGIVLFGGGVDLIENVQELTRIRAYNGLRHQVLQSIVHGARFGMPGVEKH